MKRSWLAVILVLALTLPLVACGGEAEEAEEEPAEERGLVVPDTTIVRDLNTRLDVDPRLDNPEIQLEAHSADGEVSLIGVVPSRYELSIAMEVARSTPGVHQVWLDSVRVLSEAPPDEEGEATTTTEQS
jgi:hypothetical protein